MEEPNPVPSPCYGNPEKGSMTQPRTNHCSSKDKSKPSISHLSSFPIPGWQSRTLCFYLADKSIDC